MLYGRDTHSRRRGDAIMVNDCSPVTNFTSFKHSEIRGQPLPSPPHRPFPYLLKKTPRRLACKLRTLRKKNKRIKTKKPSIWAVSLQVPEQGEFSSHNPKRFHHNPRGQRSSFSTGTVGQAAGKLLEAPQQLKPWAAGCKGAKTTKTSPAQPP